MTDEDLKKIKKVVKNEIREVKDLVEMTKKKVDNQDIFLHTTAENVRRIKEQQSIMNEKLDAHSASLVSIESKTRFLCR